MTVNLCQFDRMEQFDRIPFESKGFDIRKGPITIRPNGLSESRGRSQKNP